MFQKDYTVDINVITDYMIVTIFASVHTTSTFLTYCLYGKIIYIFWNHSLQVHKITLFFFSIELANHPQFHEELLEEQIQLHKNNENSYYTTDQVAKLEKLDSFIKETLRVHTDNGRFYISNLNNQVKNNVYKFFTNDFFF